MRRWGEVAVIGHVCLDLRVTEMPPALPPPGALWPIGPAVASVGGCVGNTAKTLAGLGRGVNVHTSIGPDPFGRVATELLSAEPAIQADMVCEVGTTTSYSIVIEHPGGDRSFLHHGGSNEHYRAQNFDPIGCRVVHVGYPSLLPALTTAEHRPLVDLLSRIRATGATSSLDLANSEVSDPTGVNLSALLDHVLPHVDVLSPSATDLVQLFPHLRTPTWEGLQAAAAALVQRGVGIAVVTAGELGAVVTTANAARLQRAGAAVVAGGEHAGRTTILRAPPIAAVRATGAGDAATAGLLHGLLLGDDPTAAARRGQHVASCHVAGIGHGEPSPSRGVSC